MMPPLGPEDVWVELVASVFGAPERARLEGGSSVAPGGAGLGTVVAAGEAASALVGQRVLVGPLVACGECGLCRRGHPAGCAQSWRLGVDTDGTLASHVLTRRRWVLPLDGPLADLPGDPCLAAVPREATLAYDMVCRASLAPGEAAVWLGADAVSQVGLALTKQRGAIGLAATPEHTQAKLRDAFAAKEVDSPVWKLFETSGRQAHRRGALALAPHGSRVTLASGEAVGRPGGDDLDRVPGLERALVVQSVPLPHPDLVGEVAALVHKGELDMTSFAEVVAVDELVRRLDEGADEGNLMCVTYG